MSELSPFMFGSVDNSDMAPVRTPYSVGWNAGYDGKGFLDNPYDPMTTDGRHWIDGLVAGMKCAGSSSPAAAPQPVQE